MVKPRDTDNGRAIVPMTQTAPARFTSYDAQIWERAYEVWSTLAGRHGTRTRRLLANELGDDIALPDASTIRRRAIEEAWHARADADLERTQGRTVYELQVGWLAGLRLAQDTLLDMLAGNLDHLPFGGGAGRLKAAEIVLRTIERAGLLAVLPKRDVDAPILNVSSMSTEEKQALARELLHERKHTKE